MLRTLTTIAAAAILMSSSAIAHEPRKGPNGGELVDAGSYHIEVIGKGTMIEVLVSDAADKPLSATGFKALAIMVISGKTQRIALEPTADGKKLIGEASAPLTSVKGAVQLTDRDGRTATGRIN
ncbi:MAG: hypothetical protein ACRCTI_04255 [Beijerinckiaceae bacterium]